MCINPLLEIVPNKHTVYSFWVLFPTYKNTIERFCCVGTFPIIQKWVHTLRTSARGQGFQMFRCFDCSRAGERNKQKTFHWNELMFRLWA